MITGYLSKLLPPARVVCGQILTRNLAVSSVALQKASDPIQQLFLDKAREYNQKSKASGGKLVDADDNLQRELDESLARTLRQFGGKTPEEMSKFPSFNFKDPALDPINLEQK
ncbi:ATP synthase-coupling factor 6, mitochondrial-like [Paramacrobiotus metropolitanus]|uniref:ATP synthase-coupling factor 6, mitochondrial-like n=1 Tax=Paramacrobiotus metropolitanus TaxID=2943436 RepID=UPI002445A6B2|nr:ATP synthase-coupling factor 6, mitochondrial-like [Paramacrobiotus metropolitanus]